MIACPSCATQMPDTARFCPECGTPNGAATPPQPEPHVQSTRTYSGFETQMPGDFKTDPPGNLKGEALAPGTLVAGKFKIERVIGEGGMGRVYLATQSLGQNEIPVALKVISEKYAANESAAARLIEEGLATRAIAHANVVRIYDIGLHGAQPYIAMEYVNGKPLHVWRGLKMAQNEPVPVAVAAQIIREVLNGLQAAHAAGFIHRDLKPENIMLVGEPTAQSATVRIVDFGIALSARGAEAGTSGGTGLGTQLYMAPEQVRNANAANAAADLYSVSRIFYELIVGVLPSGHWQPPSGGRSDVPKGIDKLIERGLSDNRDLRPQSAADYREELNTAFAAPKPVWTSNFGTTDDSKEKIKEAQNDMRAAMIKMIKAVPIWMWVLIGCVSIAAALYEADTGGGTQTNCYYDAWGNYQCS